MASWRHFQSSSPAAPTGNDLGLGRVAVGATVLWLALALIGPLATPTATAAPPTPKPKAIPGAAKLAATARAQARKPPAPPGQRARRAAVSTKSCKTVRRQLRRLAAAGRRRASCVATTSKLPRGLTVREAAERTRRARPTRVSGSGLGTDPAPSGVSAKGLGPDPAPSAVPSYCSERIGLKAPNRGQSCTTEVLVFTVYNTRTRAILGRGYMVKFEWAQLAYSSRFWIHETKINPVHATGVAAPGFFAYAAGRCYFGCGVLAAYPPDAWVFMRPGVPVQGKWLMGSPGPGIGSHAHNLDLYFHSPSTTNVAYTPTDFLPVTRCDSEPYMEQSGQTSGCVYSQVPGLFALSAAPNQEPESNVEDAAKFYRDAQDRLANHPGRLPDGVPLHRTLDTSANRDVSTPECDRRFGSPRPSGYDCDEYPFASTREGAATGNFDLRLVLREQNRRAGGFLSDFYIKQRILNGDPFYVYIYG